MAAVIDNIVPFGRWGACSEDWDHFDLILGLTRDLMPVVSNARAIVSPNSSLKEIGKVPSLYNGARQVVGLPSWTSRETVPGEITRWSREGDLGICLQTRYVRGWDTDISDAAEAADVRAFVADRLGMVLPARVRGNSSKFLLPFAMVPDDFSAFPKRILKTRTGVIEMLGDGQQFIAVGTHPSGVRYTWECPGQRPGDLPNDIPYLDQDRVEDLWQSVVAAFGVAAPIIVGASRGVSAPRTGLVRDDVVDFLEANEMVHDIDAQGRVHIVCPFEDEHTSEGGGSATSYFPAGTGGYAQGHFSCLHAHCAERTDDDFIEKLGIVAAAFDVVTAADVIDTTEQLKSKQYREQFLTAQTEEEWRAVVDAIKFAGGVGGIDLDMVVGVALKRIKEINGAVVKKDAMRDALSPPRGAKAVRVGAARMETWCEPYVWCMLEDCFIDRHTQEKLTVQSFNAAHGRDVKGRWTTDEGFQLTASQVALQELQIDVVHRRMYLPWADPVFTMDGLQYLNRYRHGDIADAVMAADWTPENRRAVEMMQQHAVNLCGETSAAHLTKWMAYCVQNPGRKIRHSILIKGTEGDGKSLFGTVLELIMGSSNVGKVSPKVLNSDFNGWAEGHCVCVVEELRMVGHNRFDVANALKEYHTNDTVSIHRKGIDAYKVINTQNYMAFTNYGDAVPLTEGDRRYFVIFSRYVGAADLIAAGMGANYFDDLFGLIRDNVGALRGWLLGVDLTGFDQNGRAPDSDAKQAMIAAAGYDEDEEIQAIIERGAVGVSLDVVSTSHLTAALTMQGVDFEIPKGRGMAVVMSRLGYSRRAKTLSWRNADCRLWVRDIRLVSDRTKIVELLEKTLVSGLV